MVESDVFNKQIRSHLQVELKQTVSYGSLEGSIGQQKGNRR